MGCEYPICQRWIPKRFHVGHVLRMSQNVSKHQLTQIEFSLYADLEEYGRKNLYNPRVMSCQHLIAHFNLVQDRVSRGEMGEVKVVFIWPCYDLSSSNDEDY